MGLSNYTVQQTVQQQRAARHVRSPSTDLSLSLSLYLQTPRGKNARKETRNTSYKAKKNEKRVCYLLLGLSRKKLQPYLKRIRFYNSTPQHTCIQLTTRK